MKPFLSLTFSFLFFAFITNLSSNNAAEPVLDINGIPVIPGNQYYIFPASGDNPKSGGLRLNKVDDQECPVTVIQNDAITGLPVRLTIQEDSSANEILTNSSVDVEFIKTPYCAQNEGGGKWNINYVLSYIEKNNNGDYKVNYYVGIGGYENYPSTNIIDGTFSIHEYGSPYIYKFVFCDITDYCLDIGRTQFNSTEGGSRLTLTPSDPYKVVFVDAALLKSGNMMSVAGQMGLKTGPTKVTKISTIGTEGRLKKLIKRPSKSMA